MFWIQMGKNTTRSNLESQIYIPICITNYIKGQLVVHALDVFIHTNL